MSFCLIILAGGKSHRFNSRISKTYEKIGGKSLIEINIIKASQFKQIKKIILVYNKKDSKRVKSLELKNIKSKLGENSNQLEVLFISLDPERDTPELLSKFIPSFDPSFIGLTGTIENIEKIAQQYKVYRKKVIQGSSYTIDHSSGLYLLDKEGRIRVRHSYGSEVKLIVEDIKKLF